MLIVSCKTAVFQFSTLISKKLISTPNIWDRFSPHLALHSFINFYWISYSLQKMSFLYLVWGQMLALAPFSVDCYNVHCYLYWKLNLKLLSLLFLQTFGLSKLLCLLREAKFFSLLLYSHFNICITLTCCSGTVSYTFWDSSWACKILSSLDHVATFIFYFFFRKCWTPHLYSSRVYRLRKSLLVADRGRQQEN